jgi:hypothetical protein
MVQQWCTMVCDVAATFNDGRNVRRWCSSVGSDVSAAMATVSNSEQQCSQRCEQRCYNDVGSNVGNDGATMKAAIDLTQTSLVQLSWRVFKLKIIALPADGDEIVRVFGVALKFVAKAADMHPQGAERTLLTGVPSFGHEISR